MQVRRNYESVINTNTKIIAISVDSEKKAKAMKRKTRSEFDFLCDENQEVTKLYGLVDSQLTYWDYIDGEVLKQEEPRNIALSANVLINKEGYITSFWSGHYNFRPDVETTIKRLEKMNS